MYLPLRLLHVASLFLSRSRQSAASCPVYAHAVLGRMSTYPTLLSQSKLLCYLVTAHRRSHCSAQRPDLASLVPAQSLLCRLLLCSKQRSTKEFRVKRLKSKLRLRYGRLTKDLSESCRPLWSMPIAHQLRVTKRPKSSVQV